jgi:hypothetical protein
MDLPEPADRLNSWKEIAAFLGRTVRTVQRWEKDAGLPLRRGGPGQRGAVCASKHEIGEWWERRRAALDIVAVPPLEPLEPLEPLKPLKPLKDEAQPILRTWLLRRRIGVIGALAALVAALITLTMALPWLRHVDPTTANVPRLGRLFAGSTTEGQTESFIPLNATPSGLTLDPSGTLAYVALYDERAVAVVDLRARRVVDRLEVLEHPGKIVLTSDGARLVIKGDSDIGVYDLRRRALRRYSLDGGRIHDLHVSSDGRFVWLTLAQQGLKILDVRTGRLDAVPTIGCPMYLAAARRSRRVFVSYQCGGPGGSWGHDAVEIIDEISRKPIIAGAKLPLVGSGLALSPDEQHLWIDANDACAIDDYDREGCPPGVGPVLHALRATSLEPLLTVRVPGGTFGAVPVFFRDGTRLVLAGPRMTVIDSALGTAIESISGALGLGQFSADGRLLVVLDAANDGIHLFETASPADAWTLRDVASHWTGDGTASDVAGGSNPVAAEPLRFERGRYGQAFAFDTRSKGIDYGRRLNVNIADDRPLASYAAWIKPWRADARRHIASRTGPRGWKWSLSREGRLAFCLTQEPLDLSCETEGLLGRTVLPPGRWSHVAVVRTAEALLLFVDGRADGSAVLTTKAQPEPDDLSIEVLRLGAGPQGTAPFEGLIDEVLFFRRPLSAGDLAQVMRATSLAAPVR